MRLAHYIANACNLHVYSLKGQQPGPNNDVHPVLVKCWSTVCNAGPAFNQHWVDISCMHHIFTLSCDLRHAIRDLLEYRLGGGPRVVVSTAAFHARVRGSVAGLDGFKETKMFLPHPRVKLSIVGSLPDREVACSTSDRQSSNFESCVWGTVSSHSSHHLQEVYMCTKVV